ncbi:uncharacterized protein LOC136026473 isoform X3 [Artemia franciscana]|uniref:uncharacterized protein LOC136026473 isoform X3 n=1 Tax=Artemia franciscana TaxID=6661 RepID=UPI0032DB7BFD
MVHLDFFGGKTKFSDTFWIYLLLIGSDICLRYTVVISPASLNPSSWVPQLMEETLKRTEKTGKTWLDQILNLLGCSEFLVINGQPNGFRLRRNWQQTTLHGPNWCQRFLMTVSPHNPSGYYSIAVFELLYSLVDRALKLHPRNHTWLKIMGDLNFKTAERKQEVKCGESSTHSVNSALFGDNTKWLSDTVFAMPSKCSLEQPRC